MADTAFSKLNQKQKRCVILYTTESKRDTYLNRVTSYESCYATTNRKSSERAAQRLFSRPDMQEAIKELLPKNAYDALIIRDKYWNLLLGAEEDDDKKLQLSILNEMAKHEGMLDKKKDNSNNKDLKKYEQDSKEAQKLWQEQMGLVPKTGS